MKKFLQSFFNPPPIPTVILAIVGFGAVLAVPIFGIDNQVYRYTAYLLSAYALVITVTGLRYLKPAISRLKHRIADSKTVKKLRTRAEIDRYFSDPHFRTRVSLFAALAINLCYIILKLSAGIIYRSAWFCALAVYYILLAAMRLVIVKYSDSPQENLIAQFRIYRLCGIMLLVMNQALAGIVIFIVYRNQGFSYSGNLIYAMAFYSFYAVITAAISVVKTRKHNSPVMSAAKAVALVAAMVSILSLTTAMLSRFDESGDTEFRRIMTASVGGGVCTIVTVMAVYMIVRAQRNLRQGADIGKNTDAAA